MNELWVFMARWLILMHTINPALKPARRLRPSYWSSRRKCARSFPTKVKRLNRSRAQSMPTRRTFFTCYGIWRAMIHGSRSPQLMKLRMNDFLSEELNNRTIMGDNSSEGSAESLMVPWTDMVRFVRQLSHDLRNDLNAIELQSAYIGELTQDQELTSEIKRLRDVVTGMNSTLQLLSRAGSELAPKVVTYPGYKSYVEINTQI